MQFERRTMDTQITTPATTLATLLAQWSGQRTTLAVVAPSGASFTETVPALPEQGSLPELWEAWREVREERVGAVLVRTALLN